MSSDLFRNQTDSNSPPTPLQWISPDETIPEWLSGVYFQIGPSFFDINAQGETTSKQFSQSVVQMKIVHFKHWFDGLSHLHRFELKGGSKDVLWNHSLISRQYEKKISETATIDHTTFGPVVIENHEVSSTVVDAFKSQSIPLNDIRNVNSQCEACNNNLGIQTVKYNNKDHLIVTGYSSVVEEINPTDYSSSKVGNLIHSSFYPSSHYIYTPHKRYDSTTNELFSLVLEVGKVSSTFHILCTSFPIGTDPSRTKPRTYLFSSIPNVRVGYNHSFAITPHFIVIMNCPYHAGTIGSGLKLSLNQGSIQKTMKFSDQLDENAICYVISRETGNLVKTFESAGFFYLNIINSFEQKIYQPKTDDNVEEDPKYNIFVDIVAYTNTSILNIFEIDQLRTPNQIDNTVNKNTWSNTIRRYCLPGVSSSQVETNNDSASVPYWEQVKEKVENPSWFVNSLVKPFAKLYYNASGNSESASATQSNNTSNSSLKPSSNDPKKSSSSINLNSKLNESELDVRFEYPASFQHLCNTTIEFPCINKDYSYKDYRYVYGLFHPKKEKAFFTHLIKIDVQTMRVIKFDPTNITNNPYDYDGDVTIPMMNEKVDIIPAGTPTFIPKPASAIVRPETDDEVYDDNTEDEGVIIAPFFDKLYKKSVLIFIDAKTFMEIGRINLPNNEFMPFGSQGTFCTV
jgi:carotenoid cleavage dioxygenase-like enzyme